MKKRKINKVSVFPPNLRRRPSVEPQEPYSVDQLLLSERRSTSQERDQSLEKTPINLGSSSSTSTKWRRPSVEPQAPSEMNPFTSSSTKWFTPDESSPGEELERRCRVLETSLSSFVMLLDDIQLENPQSSVQHMSSLQKLIKEKANVKASLESILEILKDQPNQEKLEKISLMLTNTPKKVETAMQKIQREICHTVTRDIQVLASLKMPEPVVQASVPVGESKSQISEELEQRFGVIETTLSRFGMVLDSVQLDIMQANKGTKEETERIHQKFILQDTALQQLMKKQADVKARLNEAVECILEILQEQPVDMIERISLMLTDIPEQVETGMQNMQREICHTFTSDIQVLASFKSPEPVVQASAAARKKAKENLPEQRAPAAKVFTRSKLPAARVQVQTASQLKEKKQRTRWTSEEEAKLREGVELYGEEGKNIPWKKILELGEGVFHESRSLQSLRTKWTRLDM